MRAPTSSYPRPGLRAARALSLALLLAAGCREAPAGGAADDGPLDGADAAAPGGDGGAPRRPGRRYYFARTSARCEVYRVDGETPSPPEEARCVADLAVGERIRLSGRTCMRESPADPARQVPVLCPDPLRQLEKDDIEAKDAGADADADADAGADAG